MSDAVQCGLAIVDGARAASLEHPDEPIDVGVGIHAGETIETPDGYVGGPVNIAARLCALAGPGEVLVSDTVRALTHTVLPEAFVPRGRRALKGVTDPVAVYAVVASAPSGRTLRLARLRRLPRSLRIGLAVTITAAIVAVGLLGWTALRGAAGLPPGTWKIGLDMPLTGDSASRGIPMRNAVMLAIDQANAAGGIGGAQVALVAYDDRSATNPQDEATGAANASAMVADPGIIAMVGPNSSQVASLADPDHQPSRAPPVQSVELEAWPDEAARRRPGSAGGISHPDQLRSDRAVRRHPGACARGIHLQRPGREEDIGDR